MWVDKPIIRITYVCYSITVLRITNMKLFCYLRFIVKTEQKQYPVPKSPFPSFIFIFFLFLFFSLPVSFYIFLFCSFYISPLSL